MTIKETKEAMDAANYVILCKKCGEDLGFMFDEHPKITSHEELIEVVKVWVSHD